MVYSHARAVVAYQANGQKEISYVKAGSSEGQLLIFLHGWVGIGSTWRHQIDAFVALGFFVIAPDMPGYGDSTSTKVHEDYSHENIIKGLLTLLESTKRTEAVWIGHDWGAGVLNTMMATHPEVIKASCLISVPYGSIELGLEQLVPLINRDIYPEDNYPWGQWDYMAFYERCFDKATAWLDSDPEGILKVFLAGGQRGPATYGKPGPLSMVNTDNGWFGGIPEPLPQWRDTPSEQSILGKEILEDLIKAMKKTGFYGPNSYYMNHERNRAFNFEHQKNGGRFDKPLLFIEGQWDATLNTAVSRLAEPMKEKASRLTWVSIAAGHYVSMEAPKETNAAITRWLATEVEDYWPYFFKNGHARNYSYAGSKDSGRF